MKTFSKKEMFKTMLFWLLSSGPFKKGSRACSQLDQVAMPLGGSQKFTLGLLNQPPAWGTLCILQFYTIDNVVSLASLNLANT